MRRLVIETATSACSVALFGGDTLIDHGHAVVGRGHAEALLPMIAALVDGGRADAIAVDVGPGSFTGIRVGIAAARALGFGWGVPVSGFTSLALLAAIDGGHKDTLIAIEGGHGELFVAAYDGEPLAEVDAASSLPFAAVGTTRHRRVVGNAAARLVAARGHGEAIMVEPDARCFTRLPAALTDLAPLPLYLRAADARPNPR